MKRPLILAVLTTAALLAQGCASSLSGSAYERREARSVQEIQYGTVTDVRLVRIEGTKSLLGAGTGAVVGGVLGSMVGGGKGRTLATVGGAVAGGLAGAAVEEGVTTQNGYEITVRLDNGRVLAVTQAADEHFHVGDRVRLITGHGGTARVAH